MNRDTKVHWILKILVDECQDWPKKWSEEQIEEHKEREIHKAEVLIAEAYEEE